MNTLRLRAIETVGFKSFADKIELNFVDGITAIVGPNGSGKSNVSDAIRWVLGEQSMRTLRGSSMEDVIFSGSGKRRALNIAEVTLYFTNTEGILPVEFQEVSICRRLFRSGDSAYFINKSACRLKDIHDLFADTGLGRGSLSIIGQNKVDEILNGRPEDRRIVFEETAGIVRHKLRKKEATKRLDETDNNLIRLNDIRSEISERLEPMRESAEKTKQHNLLQARFKECRVTQAVRKIDNAQKMLATAKKQIEELNEKDAGLSADLNINENKSFLLKQKLEEIAVQLNKNQQQIADFQAEIEKINGQKSVLFERVTQNEERSQNVKQDIERLQEQFEELGKQTLEFTGRLEERKNEETVAGREKIELENHLKQVDVQIKRLEEGQVKEQSDILERKRNIMQIGNDIRENQAILSSNERKKEKLAKEVQDIEDKVISLQAELKDYDEKINSYEQEKTVLLEQIRQGREATATFEREQGRLSAEEKKIADSIVSLKTRINILEKMQSEYDGFSYSVKKLMAANTSWRNEIIGTVGQLLDVPAKFVFAVETALAAGIQNIVTKDDLTAKQAIEFLKQEKAGRATFLPLNRIKPPVFNQADERFLQMPGIIGKADALIGCDNKIKPAVEFLLGRTLIAETLDAALKVNQNGNIRFRIVTLDGDIIYAAGSMSGGSRTNKESGFLSRKQEILDNKDKLVSLEEEVKKLSDAKAEITAKLFQVAKDISSFTEQVKTVELETAKLTTHKSETEKSYKQIVMGLDTVKFEHDEVNKEQEQIDNLLKKLVQAKDAAEKDDAEKIIQSEDARKQYDALKEERVYIDEKYNDANVRYQTAKGATQLLQEQHDSLSERTQQLEENKKRLEKDLQMFHDNISQAQTEKEKIHQDLLEKQKQLELTRSELDQTAAQQMELLPEQKQLEKHAKEIKEELNAVQSRLRNADSIFARYDTELGIALAQLEENYQLALDEAREFCKEELSDKELSGTILELENMINELGPVNPAAIEEYTEIKERHDFMLAQYEDLIKAKEDLRLLIRDIDNTMIRRFKEAFTAINGHFADCFARLFGGGSASLKLIDPTNILSTGVDIIVQPPGKKLQNLSLLSGGERALTVIALLFALLSYRPSPFCVLDEVDAALDEANVERFKNFVLDFAKHTQFVIITHRKTTMQAADVLHGITMEETGVSKLVSLKITERKEALA